MHCNTVDVFKNTTSCYSLFCDHNYFHCSLGLIGGKGHGDVIHGNHSTFYLEWQPSSSSSKYFNSKNTMALAPLFQFIFTRIYLCTRIAIISCRMLATKPCIARGDSKSYWCTHSQHDVKPLTLPSTHSNTLTCFVFDARSHHNFSHLTIQELVPL